MHSTGFGRLEKGRRGTRGGLWRRKISLHSNRFGGDRSPLIGELELGRRESLKAKLEHAQDLMSHVSRELEVVVEATGIGGGMDPPMVGSIAEATI